MKVWVVWFLGPFLVLLGAAGSGHAHMSLDELIQMAADLPAHDTRYSQSLKFGMRGVVLNEFIQSRSDPNVLYIGSRQGFVFSSSDGGNSWQEGRLVVRRRPFFGSLRPSSSRSGAPFSAQGNLRGMQRFGHLQDRLGNLMAFPLGAIDGWLPDEHPLLDLDPGGPAFWSAVSVPPVRRTGDLFLRDEAGQSAGGTDAARLGIGLINLY